MSAAETVLTPVRGLVDAAGRLVEADQRLHDLNTRAGGAVGRPLAVPQLATLARLAQRLGILISRGVVAGDGDDDLDLWVRAQPERDADGATAVRLAISGWRTRAAWQPEGAIEERAADLLRSGADWWWETDAALRLTSLSLDAGMRFGFDAQAMLGQPLTRLFVLAEGMPDGDGEGFPMLSALAQQRRFDDQPATLRETGLRVRLAASPRTAANGAFAGFVGAVHPLDEASPVPPTATTTSLFTARLDQALRGALDRIIANADSIHAQSEGPLRQDYADYAADIASAGRHLKDLVADLVDVEAIERPDFAVAVEPLDLADVARRAAGLLQVRAAQAQVRIARPGPDAAVPATAEFRRALQVLVNLIGNAVRFSPVDGTVSVDVQRDGDRALVVVADQGRGIAPADQARIFEKFERIDTSEPGGSGLGLYIARRLARAMGGDVTVDPMPGQGARFVFSLSTA